MSLVNFSNLDFQEIKQSIVDYLRSNSNFTDYDFEGSNLSVIIDTLAYNTYITSFNANMVSNEVFIDSATLRENVVSLARNIGYVPRSRVAARAKISFVVSFEDQIKKPVTLTLKKGMVCISASNLGKASYTFSVPDDITVPVVEGLAVFRDITIYEGILLTSYFTVDPFAPDPRFVIDNVNVDTSTLNVLVRPNNLSSSADRFRLINNLFDAQSEANIFFVQEVEDQKYELIFGDGVFGKKLNTGNYIEVSYIVTNGSDANGIKNFTFSGRLFDNEDKIITSGISPIETLISSESGEEIESVSSIKKYATKVYAAQNRAVTASDYEALMPFIYPETEAVKVYGGEDLDPPEYGKVFIALKPKFGQFVPEQVKRNLKTILKGYSMSGIQNEIIDMKFLYVEIISNVYYNKNKVLSANSAQTAVIEALNKYSSSSELSGTVSRFKYSKVQKIIDDSHPSITSNITLVEIRRDFVPEINKLAQYEICFGNSFQIIRNEEYGYNIRSSGFKVDGIDGTVYLGDIPSDDGVTGDVVFFQLYGTRTAQVVKSKAGTIDYDRGEINLFPVIIKSAEKTENSQPIIQISALPESNDVIGLQDLYLKLDVSNSQVIMISDSISSGSDPSGTTYIRTSSYSQGFLTR
jgi:hypothetical protein